MTIEHPHLAPADWSGDVCIYFSRRWVAAARLLGIPSDGCIPPHWSQTVAFANAAALFRIADGVKYLMTQARFAIRKPQHLMSDEDRIGIFLALDCTDECGRSLQSAP